MSDAHSHSDPHAASDKADSHTGHGEAEHHDETKAEHTKGEHADKAAGGHSEVHDETKEHGEAAKAAAHVDEHAADHHEAPKAHEEAPHHAATTTTHAEAPKAHHVPTRTAHNNVVARDGGHKEAAGAAGTAKTQEKSQGWNFANTAADFAEGSANLFESSVKYTAQGIGYVGAGIIKGGLWTGKKVYNGASVVVGGGFSLTKRFFRGITNGFTQAWHDLENLTWANFAHGKKTSGSSHGASPEADAHKDAGQGAAHH